MLLSSTAAFKAIRGGGGKEQINASTLFAKRFENVGATTMDRDGFGPVRKPLKAESLPFDAISPSPLRPAEPDMEGRTTFYSVTDGIDIELGLQIHSTPINTDRPSGGIATIVVSGLIAELILPGMVAVGAAFLVIWGFNIAAIAALSPADAVFLIPLALLAAYLVGLITREVSVVRPTKYFYRKHLEELWPEQARFLIKHLASERPRLTRVPITVDEAQPLALEEEWTHDFIGSLRDYLLARCASDWSQYLMYQWNVARLARNSIFPLWTLTAAAAAVGARYLTHHDTAIGIKLLVAALVVFGISLGLRYVYRVRLCWHAEILVRTACAMVAFDGFPPHT